MISLEIFSILNSYMYISVFFVIHNINICMLLEIFHYFITYLAYAHDTLF